MQIWSDGRVCRAESEWRAIVAGLESKGQLEVGFSPKAKLSRKSSRVGRKRLATGDVTHRIRATRKPRPAPAGFVEWVAPTPSPTINREPRAGVEFALPSGGVVRCQA